MQGTLQDFFRNPPSPLPKGAPPLPVSPLLRRGEKRKIAESIFRNVLVSRDDAIFFFIIAFRDILAQNHGAAIKKR